MGGARDGPQKPRLRGTAAGNDCRRTAASARGADGGGPSGQLLAGPGDAVFIKAGTVHTLADVVVFQVQENSDVTFRLYDWDRVDAKTGQPRALHVDQALACIDSRKVAIGPTAPVVESTTPVRGEWLFDCEHFRLWRLRGETPFTVGVAGAPRVLVCINGAGQLEHGADSMPIRKGDVLLMPAVVGGCCFSAAGRRELVRGRDAGAAMKKLIVFDLDGTLAESKAPLDDEMAELCATSSASSKWPSFPEAIGHSSRHNYSPTFPMTNA